MADKGFEIKYKTKCPQISLLRFNIADESVKHLLSHCSRFVSHGYKRRHDRVLQTILFHWLYKHGLINPLPPWYTQISIKQK